MTDFINSKTYRNLSNAFAGESQARNRYSFWAKQAKEEGYREVQEVFEVTADQEQQHAKIFYKHIVELLGDLPAELSVVSTYPVEFRSTADNLVAAAQGENDEWTDLYPKAAQEAKEEGYDAVARSYNAIVVSERYHEERFLALLEKVREEKYFEEDESITWYCMNCGYIAEGKVAPKLCPACQHPQSHFQRLANWY